MGAPPLRGGAGRQRRGDDANRPARSLPFCFKLDFAAPLQAPYYFAASTEEDRSEWMTAVQFGSYEYLRTVLLSLQCRMRDLTGKDPLANEVMCITSPEVPGGHAEAEARAYADRAMALAVRRPCLRQ